MASIQTPQLSSKAFFQIDNKGQKVDDRFSKWQKTSSGVPSLLRFAAVQMKILCILQTKR